MDFDVVDGEVVDLIFFFLVFECNGIDYLKVLVKVLWILWDLVIRFYLC